MQNPPPPAYQAHERGPSGGGGQRSAEVELSVAHPATDPAHMQPIG